jgi:hypothetical protein
MVSVLEETHADADCNWQTPVDWICVMTAFCQRDVWHISVLPPNIHGWICSSGSSMSCSGVPRLMSGILGWFVVVVRWAGIGLLSFLSRNLLQAATQYCA